MNFKFSEDQIAIRDAIQKICADFPLDYWLECDNTGNFPKEFVSKVCEAGWFGIAMPEEYGGSGLGITEASIRDGPVNLKKIVEITYKDLFKMKFNPNLYLIFLFIQTILK
mgnify:CR=1 FL=1